MKTMAAGEFKAKCLKVMDEVAATGEPVLITKRGKPVARVVSPEEAPARAVDAESIFDALHGLIATTSDLDDLVGPIIPEEEWDHLKEDWSPFPPE
ncbi:MAG: type II toxin-antitoxin system Phd/YefM family antitoxin [Terracidiphilus sp.]